MSLGYERSCIFCGCQLIRVPGGTLFSQLQQCEKDNSRSWKAFFCLPAARVRVPDGSPFSQLQRREKTIPVRENKNIYDHWPKQWNESIKHTQKQISSPRKSASETKEPFRSQVIYGARKKKGESAQRSHWKHRWRKSITKRETTLAVKSCETRVRIMSLPRSGSRIPVREKQQKHLRLLAKTMKRIDQTNSKRNFLRGRVRQRQELFRSQVINGAQKKGTAQRSHWVRDTGDKRRIRSNGYKRSCWSCDTLAWFSCLAQLHLRGRGWTHFSPLFNH